MAEIAASLECDPSIVHKFLAATYISPKSKNALKFDRALRRLGV